MSDRVRMTVREPWGLRKGTGKKWSQLRYLYNSIHYSIADRCNTIEPVCLVSPTLIHSYIVLIHYCMVCFLSSTSVFGCERCSFFPFCPFHSSIFSLSLSSPLLFTLQINTSSPILPFSLHQVRISIKATNFTAFQLPLCPIIDSIYYPNRLFSKSCLSFSWISFNQYIKLLLTGYFLLLLFVIELI